MAKLPLDKQYPVGISSRMTLTQMAARLDVTRERVRQLVAEGRIRPAPKMIPFGPKNHVYIFAAKARKVGKDGKPGRPKKPLDKAKSDA